ncbi:uncharacterized protein METZ01_LOCUS259069, partial [marine metagenome]
MKKLLLVLCVGAMFVGCGESDVPKPNTSLDDEDGGGFETTLESDADAQSQGADPTAFKAPEPSVLPANRPVPTTIISDVDSNLVVVADNGGLVVDFAHDNFIVERRSANDTNSLGVAGHSGIRRKLRSDSSLALADSGPFVAGVDRRQFEQEEGVPRPFVPGEEPSTEEYDRIYEN